MNSGEKWVDLVDKGAVGYLQQIFCSSYKIMDNAVWWTVVNRKCIMYSKINEPCLSWTPNNEAFTPF